MDMVDALETAARAQHRRPLPSAWRCDARLVDLATVDQLVQAIRKCDGRSDRVLTALIERGPGDASAAVVILTALLRLALPRCRGDSDRVDALAGELALVLGEAWDGQLSATSRRLANVMVDRAWGRVRASERRGRWQHSVDLDAIVDRVGRVRSHEDDVVTRVTMDALGPRLRTRGRAPVAKAWARVLELTDDHREADKHRWRHARDVLRHHVTPDLELIDGVNRQCEAVSR